MGMEMVLPGPILQGVTLKNGNRLRYPMNGLPAYFFSHLVVVAGSYYGYIDPTYVWRNMGALLTGGVISTYIVSLWQYLDYGLGWKRHVNDPEFEEDWGVFSWKECISDFWLGTVDVFT